jgi:hypothetical protein
MRFPLLESLYLPVIFETVVPGQLHPDGQRYLPLILLRLNAPHHPHSTAAGITPPDLRLGVVDRHHRVDQMQVGQSGVAQLLFLLGTIRLQSPPYRQGFVPEPALPDHRAGTMPTLLGQVTAVPTWEVERANLPYEQLFAELLLDTGCGTVGVRSSATAGNLANVIGAAQINPGDWIEVSRSRVDILEFDICSG